MAERRGLSVRARLLAIALAPMLVVLPALLGISVVRWWDKFDAALITKVNGDLTIARQHLSRLKARTGERLGALGRSAAFARVVAGASEDDPAVWLARAREELGLDFLYLRGPEGRVRATAPAGAESGPAGAWPIVAEARAEGVATAIDLFSAEQLAAISPRLAERARIPLVPTEAAVPTDRAVETRGMVIHAAAAAPLGRERTGVLVGGLLLNRNLDFIDRINALVYRPASLPEGSEGTATLFLDDVRVSTNVRMFSEERALGTRVSAEVRAHVLGAGRIWRDRAFVVNDWYVSAYEPIEDSFGERIGMLYVGFLETPFRAAKTETMVTLGLLFLVAAAVTVPVFLRWAGAIFRPLEAVTATIARVEGGELSARTGQRGAGEIARVAAHLDGLLDQVQARDAELRARAEELDARVEARTAELTEANRRLEAATEQLVMSEKLAAIGEITAGVAHEINNPVAVIQGNLEVARDAVGPEAEARARTEFALIDQQVQRINRIVTKLLQFARPEEYAGFEEAQDPAGVIEDCLPLVAHLLERGAIAVVRADRAERRAAIERVALQQILVNLMTNAIQAMPEGGTLTLETADGTLDGAPAVEIRVADTGTGIEAETLRRVFDPFFTTKRRTGTGLGLSISQRLARQAGGRITVESAHGAGTAFTVHLPAA